MNEPFTPEAGKLYRVIVTIQNIGKTPAKNLKTTFVIEPAEKDGAPNFDYTNDQKAIVGLLSPGVNHKLTLRPVNSRSTGEERPLTQELADAITSGRTRIFVHGRVDYEDIFGQPHWISFCAHTLFPMADNFGIWPTHNETDE